MPTADCPNYQCSDIGIYDPGNSCSTYKGGNNKLLLVKCGVDIDLSSGSEINSAITAGEAVLIENLKIDWGAPSAVTVPSYVGCVPDVVSTYDHTINITDRNVIPGSIDFWNSAGSATGVTFGAALIWNCSENRVFEVDAQIQIQGGVVNPDQKTDLQRFELTATYQSTNGSPVIMRTPPTGIFI